MVFNKITIEKATVKAMIEIYCKSNHQQRNVCSECAELIDYALLRTDKCKYGEAKPTCKKCLTHCYNKEHKNKIREIMRFSGKRMLIYHPILSVKHLLTKLKH